MIDLESTNPTRENSYLQSHLSSFIFRNSN